MNISQISPWNFLFFSNEVPGRSRGGMALQIPARSGPGARGRLGERRRKSLRTFWWSWIGGRRSGRCSTAVDRKRRRRFNGGEVIR